MHGDEDAVQVRSFTGGGIQPQQACTINHTTQIEIMHSLALYTNGNHHNLMPNPNLNLIITLTLKPSLNRPLKKWGPAKMSSLSKV